MKPFLLLVFSLVFKVSLAQLSTESFESASPGNFFNSNGIRFNIISGGNSEIFEVINKNNSYLFINGWSGTGTDNQYIDNSQSAGNNGSQMTIKTNGGEDFVFKSVYLYLWSSSTNTTSFSGGSLTIQGKNNGSSVFSANMTSGFNTSATNAGYTFIDLANFGGQNNANKVIDEIVISVNNVIDYLALDAFKWYKYSSASALSSSLLSQTNVSCNGGGNGVATVSVTGGISPYTYSWSPNGGSLQTATGLTAGNYTCTITDDAGVTKTQSVTITQPSVLNATTVRTDVSCNGGTNGTASVFPSGGAGGYTYSWNVGGATGSTITGRIAGTYFCTITDANSCQITRSVIITQPTVISASSSSTNVSCNGGSNGTASVSSVTGGVGGYTYSWSPGGSTVSTITGRVAGTYTCTITDANSCQITRALTITQPTVLSASATKTDVSCNGGANGMINVTAAGGAGAYTYSWSPAGGTAATANGLSAGTYTCTITDANSCVSTSSVTLTEPAILSAGSSQSNVTCNGGSNGTSTISVSGGTPPYTYSWNYLGGTQATISNLSAGSYFCTILDAKSCQITKGVTITQPPALVINSITNSPICLGDEISLNTTSDATQVVWKLAGNTISTSTNFSNVSSNKVNVYSPTQTGIYSAVVSNAAGCTVTSSNVVVNSTPSATGFQSVSGNVNSDTYLKNNCTALIAKLSPSGANPVSGNVTAKVWIESAQPSAPGSQYVKRHYEITPATNPSLVTGKVTLYFTQTTEFDDFNAVSPIDLPTNSSDIAGISHLLIEKRSGTSSDGTGLPSTYSSTVSTIDPADADIIWNGTDNRWEVSFDVTGFSGFFVKSALGSLPVNWLAVSGTLSTESKPVLSWKVNEFNVSQYLIERSTDGKMFSLVDAVMSRGDGVHAYQYQSTLPISANTYFRIKQIDKDGKFSYSIVLKLQQSSLRMMVYPIPFNESITIISNLAQKGYLYSMNGSLVKTIDLLKGMNIVFLNGLAPGQFILQTENGFRQKLIKQ